MGGADPDTPWPTHGNKPIPTANTGEGSSNNHSDEKKHLFDQEMEMNPPEYDGEDPPTPPEEYPEDPWAKLPDRSRQPPADDEEPGDDAPPKEGHGRRGRGCRRGRSGERSGPWRPGHPHSHGPHPWWGHGRPGRGGGGFRGRGRGGLFGGPPSHHPFPGRFPPHPPPFGPFGFGGGWAEAGRGGGWMEMAKKFAERLGIDPSQLKDGQLEEGVDFEPAIDVYSTPSEYVVHLALPGAKKEDVGVTWDEGQAALTVAGVLTRGVDEEMVSQLAVGERQVGFFKRIVRLGDREHPAKVDADSIAAKMEEGILKITVGKVEEFVEVKKVEVE